MTESIAEPLAAPDFPVIESGSQHGLGSFVQPGILSLCQIAFDGGDGFATAEVNVGGFPAHVVEQALFLAFLGESLNFNVAAVGSEAPDDPVLREMHVRIENAHGAENQVAAQNFRGVQAARPDPGGRSELLGFADDVRAVPFGKSENAGMPEAAEAGMRERNS